MTVFTHSPIRVVKLGPLGQRSGTTLRGAAGLLPIADMMLILTMAMMQRVMAWQTRLAAALQTGEVKAEGDVVVRAPQQFLRFARGLSVHFNGALMTWRAQVWWQNAADLPKRDVIIDELY